MGIETCTHWHLNPLSVHAPIPPRCLVAVDSVPVLAPLALLLPLLLPLSLSNMVVVDVDIEVFFQIVDACKERKLIT